MDPTTNSIKRTEVTIPEIMASSFWPELAELLKIGNQRIHFGLAFNRSRRIRNMLQDGRSSDSDVERAIAEETRNAAAGASASQSVGVRMSSA